MSSADARTVAELLADYFDVPVEEAVAALEAALTSDVESLAVAEEPDPSWRPD